MTKLNPLIKASLILLLILSSTKNFAADTPDVKVENTSHFACLTREEKEAIANCIDEKALCHMELAKAARPDSEVSTGQKLMWGGIGAAAATILVSLLKQ